MDMTGNTNPKWYYQLVENVCVYFQAKNQLKPPPPVLFWRYCEDINFLFCVLWVCLVGHTQNDSINLYKTSMFICMPKKLSLFTSFLRYYSLKNPAISSADSILAHNSRTRILSDMVLVVKCVSCSRVPVVTWQLFSEFHIFCNLFHHLSGEWNNNKIGYEENMSNRETAA